MALCALQAAPAPAATPPSVAAAAIDEGVTAHEAVVAALTGLSVLHHYAPAPETEVGPLLLPDPTQLPASTPAAVAAAAAALPAGAAPGGASELTAGDIASTTVGKAGRDNEEGLDAEELAAKWEAENPWWDEAERQAQRQKAKLKVGAWGLGSLFSAFPWKSALCCMPANECLCL